MSSAEILIIRDVALLRVGEKKSSTMAQKGDLPALNVRGQWRFRRFDIDGWVSAQLEHPKAELKVGEGDE